jgi:hypothetical protein
MFVVTSGQKILKTGDKIRLFKETFKKSRCGPKISLKRSFLSNKAGYNFAIYFRQNGLFIIAFK